MENGKITKTTYQKVKRQLNHNEKNIMEKVETICQNLRSHSTRKFKLHIYKNVFKSLKLLQSCSDEF